MPTINTQTQNIYAYNFIHENIQSNRIIRLIIFFREEESLFESNEN